MATKRQIRKTSYFSYLVGKPAKGCQLCVKGFKLVLFITGICSQNQRCFYCPVSEQKSGKDVIFANEWKIASPKDIIKEAELTDAKGAGITGGDPLVKLDRVVRYIKMLKKRFGKKFHIHLYTPLNLVTEAKLKRLYQAGLDEIRFHPMLDKPKEWKRIELAKKFKWDVGVEIPVIPGKKRETIKLIDFIKDKVDFLNLNELEISDTNVNKLVERGFKPKNKFSYGVKGSEKLAKELLNCLKKSKLNIHYCTTTTKDKAQLAKRIKRRAVNVALKTDFITTEGTLVRGVIYLPELKPDFGYGLQVESADNRKYVIKLKKIKRRLQNQLKIPAGLLHVDSVRLRILTSIALVDDLKDEIKKLHLVPAIVEEYPTWDALEVDVQFL
ncbi:radical SAM protein [Candidatus Woesearchaeota archaeon]|nr:radical SAM protein [Candidatus Woesearchaeota archaeon]MBW3005931.1 radical SAM protein [Candidatus Woesearchaeota archaeon]